MKLEKKEKEKTEKEISDAKLYTHNFRKEKVYPIPTGTFPMFM